MYINIYISIYKYIYIYIIYIYILYIYIYLPSTTNVSTRKGLGYKWGQKKFIKSEMKK